MVLNFTPNDWTKAVKELIRVTKPGGWVELLEFNYEIERMGPNVQLIVKAGGYYKEGEDILNSSSLTRELFIIIPIPSDQSVRG